MLAVFYVLNEARKMLTCLHNISPIKLETSRALLTSQAPSVGWGKAKVKQKVFSARASLAFAEQNQERPKPQKKNCSRRLSVALIYLLFVVALMPLTTLGQILAPTTKFYLAVAIEKQFSASKSALNLGDNAEARRKCAIRQRTRFKRRPGPNEVIDFSFQQRHEGPKTEVNCISIELNVSRPETPKIHFRSTTKGKSRKTTDE